MSDLFDPFVEDGFKGVLRDSILACDVLMSPGDTIWSREFSCVNIDPYILSKVMREFEDSGYARFLHLSENTQDISIRVEMALELVQDAVRDMMAGIFGRAIYEIHPQKWDWLGNDLVIRVTVYEDHEPARRTHEPAGNTHPQLSGPTGLWQRI